ncbi:hypothetical protein, partial [Xanthomonas translucens]|uniref:hypothetical protein n=1 Tax=Xanthomonas campestris pv. translucens TaxID=343 RepID=UPI001E551740
ATSSLPTLVKFERTLVQLFGLGNEVDVRPPWLLHVLEHCGLSACRTSLSTQTVKQPLDTSGFSRDRHPTTRRSVAVVLVPGKQAKEDA